MTLRKPKHRKPAGRPPQPPWRQSSSLLAGLPATRAEWLAIVLPAMDATLTHPRCAALLTAAGFPVDADGVRPGSSVARWYAWLVAERRAHRLPERTMPLPARTAGGQVGDTAPPGTTYAERVVDLLRATPRASAGALALNIYGVDDHPNRNRVRSLLFHGTRKGKLRCVGAGEYEVASETINTSAETTP